MKKVIKWALPFLVLLVSLKAVFFTWNLILANYHLRGDKQKAGIYMYKNLRSRSAAYQAFKKFDHSMIDDIIVKKAIYTKYKDNKDIFADFDSQQLSRSRFETLYKDNFYFQHLFPRREGLKTSNVDTGGGKGDWRNLDTVSLEIMADPAMNPLTFSILEKMPPPKDTEFIKNLLDYCSWQKNIQLRDFLAKTFCSGESYENQVQQDIPWGLHWDESIEGCRDLLYEKYRLTAGDLGENLVDGPAFEDESRFPKQWYFSKMASREPFADGSFVMGPDRDDSNGYLRVMGLYIDNQEGKSPARGGVWSRERIALREGFYFFSFDYFTLTGKETPSFFLWRGIKEIRLPPTKETWKKVIFILNNASAQFDTVKPLFRIWGTGTLLVDNVCLAQITNPAFSIPGPHALMIRIND
jgi:hypothetical protein